MSVYGQITGALGTKLKTFTRGGQVVLEGEVMLTSDGGQPHTFRKGDSFLLPKGFKGTWHQPGPMLKYYVIIG